jgi:hypothetical protein
MVDAIGSASTGWTPSIDDDDDEVRRRAAGASTAKVATAPPEIPQGPDVSGALLMRAAQAQTAPAARPLLAMGIDAASLPLPDQDTATQKRMNTFLETAMPTYHLPPEKGRASVDVKVATPFQMVSKTVVPPGPMDETTRRFVEHEASVKETDPVLKAIGASVGLSPGTVDAIKAGRGTPGQVQTITQALLDANKLPLAKPGEPIDVRVRRMMSDHGVGFDCAGFTQQAFLAAHATTRAQVGFDPQIMNENLSNLSSRHFSSVAPEDARAGDVIVLGPRDPSSHEPGHRLIVFDRHDATPEELARYCAKGSGAVLAAHGRVTVMTVDSSFGASGNPAQGGVQRQTWLYDPVSGRWGKVIPPNEAGGRSYPERVAVQDTPLDVQHRLLGIHHYTRRP